MLAGLAIVVIAFAVALWVQSRAAYSDCVTRNVRAQQTGAQLSKLVVAYRADGATHAAAIWEGFERESRAHPLPPCNRPPFTSR